MGKLQVEGLRAHSHPSWARAVVATDVTTRLAAVAWCLIGMITLLRREPSDPHYGVDSFWQFVGATVGTVFTIWQIGALALIRRTWGREDPARARAVVVVLFLAAWRPLWLVVAAAFSSTSALIAVAVATATTYVTGALALLTSKD